MKITEKACGVILISRKENAEDRFLIVRQNNNTKSWSFPKGHIEEGETPKETALRELEEETGITKIEFSNLPNIFEEYDFEKNGEIRHKINELFIAFAKDEKVKIQEGEIMDYKWATYSEAMETFTYDLSKNNLDLIVKYLKK